MERILVAVDLSDLAAAVLDYAAMMAKTFNSHVRLLHVEVPSPSYIGNEIGPAVVSVESDEDQDRLNYDLKAMTDYLTTRGVKAEYEIGRGPVEETIIEKARQFNADLLVMGAHSRGFLYRAFVGSVCAGVVKGSPCPVTIIPGK